MGAELLEDKPTEEKTYTEIFNEYFSFYLSIGMPSTEYWEGDASLVRYYRRAFKMRQEHEDHIAWLNGLYVYDALTTALHNVLRGKGQKARDYCEMPVTMKKEKVNEPPTETKVKEAKAQASVWMQQLVNKYKK